MYIEVHEAITGHPKTTRLARTLGCSRPQAVGMVIMLQLWAMPYAPDGNLTKFDAEELADACAWDGEPKELVDALVKCGWIDRDGRHLYLHDWDQYGGKVVKKYQRERERAARRRNADEKAKDLQTDGRPDGRPADVPRPSAQSTAAEESRGEESNKEQGTAKPSPTCEVDTLESLERAGWQSLLEALLGPGAAGKAYNPKSDFGRAFAAYRQRVCSEAAALSRGLGDPPSGCEVRRRVCELAVKHQLEAMMAAREADPSLRPAQMLRQLLKRGELLEEDDILALRFLEKRSPQTAVGATVRLGEVLVAQRDGPDGS